MNDNLNAFKETLNEPTVPKYCSVYLQALWYDARNDWKRAHEIIQDIEDKNAAWVHAYLHRKEGDISNANYWYNKAKRTMPLMSLEEEWNYITTYFLNESSTV